MTSEEILLKLKEAKKIVTEVLDNLEEQLNPGRYNRLYEIEKGLRSLAFEYHNLIEQGESSNES